METLSILGSGWLGLPLAKELSAKYDIKLSTRNVEKKELLISKNITPYIVNIEDFNKSIETFLNSNILIVNIPSKDVESFKNFMEKIENSTVKKIIFISSTSVYKDNNSYVTEENKNHLNDTQLVEIEKMFIDLKHIDTTILRFAGLVGYDRNLVKHFQNKTVSNSKAVVNMIHRDDCINIIKQILQKDVFGEVFNCCASTHPTKEEFYRYCAEISNLENPHFDDEMYHYKIVDNNKLKEKINYKYIYDDLLNIKFELDEKLEYEESDDKLFMKN